jgi:putative transposase
MKFQFIAKHRGIWPVAWMCGALGVSRSGFHAWLIRPPSQRARDDEVIGAKVRASHVGSYRTYGARRVWHDLLADGVSCGLHRIERLMRAQGLRARPRRRGLPKDHGDRSVIAGNVLDRQFTADRPNQKWVADFTYIWTAEGWLYVAAVIDLFSRRVVGWSMTPNMTAQLVTDALIMAIWRRGKPDALLHHSDQGSQYTSEQFQRLMADNGVTCSMSRSGNVWDKHLTVHADHSVGAGQIRGAGANVPPISLARDASFRSAHAGRISHPFLAQDCNWRMKSASEGLLLALRRRDFHAV